MKKILKDSINKLAADFTNKLDFTFNLYNKNGHQYLMNSWPGSDDEDVMICVYKGNSIDEPFHRQDFFFMNYAYENNYATQSDEKGTITPILEGDCYIGQPYNGYSLRATEPEDVTIVGVLIKRDVFIKDYLQTLATDSRMFNFFLEPQKDYFSSSYIQIKIPKDSPIRTLLEMMIIEYAHKKEDTQVILKPMILTFFMMIARLYRTKKTTREVDSLSEEIIQYIADNPENVSLKEVADHFSYHPNYISSLIHKETGETFSKIVLKQRMRRAKLLLKNTKLSVEEIAYMLGYSNPSNFYKAFKRVYKKSPREI